ncbi:MAG: glycosyltransferase, partial [Verrucomicrobiae bacterium]|nr:glycosyltransferase [Verrucomicrobiae bacterium]
CHWDRPRTNTYLFVGELTAYKRADLAVEACTRLNLPLWVIGTGAEEARLRKRAGPTVEILGWRSDQEVRERMAQAKALLFPGEEDFGITPVEAMASGCPVIAYGKGGVLDTVVDRRSGVYFHEPAVESLAAALEQFEHGIKDLWSPGELRRHAEQFDRPIFQKKLREFLGKYLE